MRYTLVHKLVTRVPFLLARASVYLWVLPGSMVGLVGLPLVWASGGQSHFVGGVLEIHGGLVTRLLVRHHRWMKGPISAITLGHVVWGASQKDLNRTRIHERVHVRQYERWGPVFIPAYLAASIWVWARGGNPYFDNPFEVEAYSVSDAMAGPMPSNYE